MIQYCRDFEPWKPPEPFSERKERGLQDVRKLAVLCLFSAQKLGVTRGDKLGRLACEDPVFWLKNNALLARSAGWRVRGVTKG